MVEEGAWERTGMGELKLTTWVECVNVPCLGEEESCGEGVSCRGEVVVGITGLGVGTGVDWWEGGVVGTTWDLVEGRWGAESVTIGSAEGGGVTETGSVTTGSVVTVDIVGGVDTETGDGECGSVRDTTAGSDKDASPPSFGSFSWMTVTWPFPLAIPATSISLWICTVTMCSWVRVVSSGEDVIPLVVSASSACSSLPSTTEGV